MSDDINDDEVPISGKKRSVRDRLGSNVSESNFYESQQRNKRYLSRFCYFHSFYRLQSFELHCNIRRILSTSLGTEFVPLWQSASSFEQWLQLHYNVLITKNKMLFRSLYIGGNGNSTTLPCSPCIWVTAMALLLQ